MFQNSFDSELRFGFQKFEFKIVSDFDIRIWSLGNKSSFEVCRLKL